MAMQALSTLTAFVATVTTHAQADLSNAHTITGAHIPEAELQVTSQQCGGAAFDYCCLVGTPCRCHEPPSAGGQCGGKAYDYCCNFGTPCICAGKMDANATTVAAIVETVKTQAELDLSEAVEAKPDLPEATVETNEKEDVPDVGLHETSKQCGGAAFDYCCLVGTPCRCHESSSAGGQCGGKAYDYCCNFGTPCICAGKMDANATTVV